MFCTFRQCSRMRGVFYHSVIHGLSFFISIMLKILCAESRNNKAHRSTNWRNLTTLNFQNFLLLCRVLHQKFLQRKCYSHLKMLTGGNVVKKIKHAFSMFYAGKTWVFDQSERDDLPRLRSSHRKLPKRLLVPASTYTINLRNTLMNKQWHNLANCQWHNLI